MEHMKYYPLLLLANGLKRFFPKEISHSDRKEDSFKGVRKTEPET
jgi:hypothetical protein